MQEVGLHIGVILEGWMSPDGQGRARIVEADSRLTGWPSPIQTSYTIATYVMANCVLLIDRPDAK